MRRKSIVKKAITLMVTICFILQSIPYSQVALAETENDCFAPYMEGGEAGLDCFPPVDTTECLDFTTHPKLMQLMNAVQRKCGETITDTKVYKKLALALPALLLPGGYAFVAAYVKSKLSEAAAKCILKGIMEYCGLEDQESVIDLAFAIHDLNQFKQKMLKVDAQITPGTFYSIKGRIEDISEIDSMTEFLREEFGGPLGKARNRIEDVNECITNCQFYEAEENLDEADRYLQEYCKKAGERYRWEQKNVRCIKEALKAYLSSQGNLYERWPYNLEAPSPSEEMPNYYPYEYYEKSTIELQAALRDGEREILKDLKFYEHVKQKSAELLKAWDEFDAIKEEYNDTVKKCMSALRQNALEDVCKYLIEIKKIEDQQRKISDQCAMRLGPYSGDTFYGEFFEESLKNKTKVLEETIEDYLSKAEKNLNRPCNLEAFTEYDSKIDLLIGDLVIYEEGKCIPSRNADALKKRFEKLTNIFREITINDDALRECFCEAEKLAQNTCTYDQALTGETSEERINDYVLKGCLNEDEVAIRIKKIKKLKEMFAKKAEVEEKAILDLIQKAKDLVDPKVPSCQVEEARAQMDEAFRRFSEYLDCASDDYKPSKEVKARSKRVRSQIIDGQKFVEDRDATIQKAYQIYRQTLSRYTDKLSDICHFKEALSDEVIQILKSHIPGFCGEEEIVRDIASIHEQIKEIDISVKTILDQFYSVLEQIKQEEDCELIEQMIEEAEEYVSELKECGEYREFIEDTLEEMKLILKKKRDEANRKLNQAISNGKIALEQCDNLTYHLNALALSNLGIHVNCVDANLIPQRESLIQRIKDHLREHDQAKNRIENLCMEAQSTVQTCEWEVFDEQISEARITLPPEPCFSKNSIFPFLSNRIDNLERLQDSRIKEVSVREAKLRQSIANLRNYFAAWQESRSWGPSRQSGLEENVGPIQDLLKEIDATESKGFGICLQDLIAEARDLLGQVQELGPGGDDEDGEESGGFEEHGQESSPVDEGQTGFRPIDNLPGQKNDLGEVVFGELDSVTEAIGSTIFQDPDSEFNTAMGMDCSPWPGSVSVYNAQKEQSECVCPSGWAWNHHRTACINCRENEANFYGALDLDNVNIAQDLLQESANCYWHAQGRYQLESYLDHIQQARHEWEVYCLQLESAIIRACAEHSINEAQSLLAQAQQNNCPIKTTTYNAVQQEIAWQRQQNRNARQQHVLNQFLNNLSTLIQQIPRDTDQDFVPPRQEHPPIPTARPPSTSTSISPSQAPSASPPTTSRRCNRRAKCESWSSKKGKWIISTGYGDGGWVEVGGSCKKTNQTRCWDECDQRWRCYEH
jgi:hypothetical protein